MFDSGRPFFRKQLTVTDTLQVIPCDCHNQRVCGRKIQIPPMILDNMVSRWELNHRYDKYIESIENANLIAVNDEQVDRPTQETIQQDDINLDVRDTSVNNSHKLLLSYDDSRAGIRFLSHDILTWLPVKLTDVLGVNVCRDHEEYWWFTHDFSRAFTEETQLFPVGLIDNFELLIRLVLSVPPMGWSTEQKQSREILMEAKTLATYLAYPTLEGFVKIACRRDIRLNGKIREGRAIRRLTQPDCREYMSHDDGDGVCSNIGMLLWHFETEITRPQNQILLRDMRERIGEIFGHPPDRIYGLLNDFRNDSLHGRDRAPKEHGVLLNLISLIIWTTLN